MNKSRKNSITSDTKPVKITDLSMIVSLQQFLGLLHKAPSLQMAVLIWTTGRFLSLSLANRNLGHIFRELVFTALWSDESPCISYHGIHILLSSWRLIHCVAPQNISANITVSKLVRTLPVHEHMFVSSLQPLPLKLRSLLDLRCLSGKNKEYKLCSKLKKKLLLQLPYLWKIINEMKKSVAVFNYVILHFFAMLAAQAHSWQQCSTLLHQLMLQSSWPIKAYTCVLSNLIT